MASAYVTEASDDPLGINFVNHTLFCEEPQLPSAVFATAV
jgi:hypothetical protein